MMTPIGTPKKAFTLPEVIVGISILVLVIMAATSLLVSIIRTNNENVNTIVAYHLAQEGLEGMRNIRDSNWLLGADFQGQAGTVTKAKVWGEVLPASAAEGEIRYYILDFNYLENNSNDQSIRADLQTIANYAPWKLKDVTPSGFVGMPAPEQTRLYLQKKMLMNNVEQVRYVHDPSLPQSPFYRYLKVEPFASKYRVTCVVGWVESGRDKKVSLTTELTDWKGGPL